MVRLAISVYTQPPYGQRFVNFFCVFFHLFYLHFFRIRVAPFSLRDVILFIAPKSDHCLAMSLTCEDAEFKEPLLE